MKTCAIAKLHKDQADCSELCAKKNSYSGTQQRRPKERRENWTLLQVRGLTRMRKRG